MRILPTLPILTGLVVTVALVTGCLRQTNRHILGSYDGAGATSSASVAEDSGSSRATSGAVAVEENGVSLRVPYSSEWSVDGAAASVVDTDQVGADWALRFGRPVDAGTFRTREFLLVRSDAMERPLLLITDDHGCSDDRPATVVVTHDVTGVLHFVGGAAGCSVAFAFEVGKHTYDLRKIPPIGADAPQLDDAMGMIAGSVRETH